MFKKLPTAAIAVALLSVLAACSATSAAPQNSPATVPPLQAPALDPAGWNPDAYARLTTLIEANANQHKLVTFDWDNTMQARDTGEGTLAQVATDGTLTPATVPPATVPSFTIDGKKVDIQQGLVPYYDSYASITSGPRGNYPSATWLDQIYSGWTVDKMVNQTKRAYANGAGAKDLVTGGSTEIGTTGILRQFPYPQMADFMGYLQSRGYDVWVVSAGNVWAVRWMIKNALNPIIAAKYGSANIHSPENVVGIATLVQNASTGEMQSEAGMRAIGNEAYFNLDPTETRKWKITQIIDPAISYHGGKVAGILETIGRQDLFLAAGDSDGDYYMLPFAQNQLWITRLNTPSLQPGIITAMNGRLDNFIAQPVFSAAEPGFLPNHCAMEKKTSKNPSLAASAKQSLSTMTSAGLLKDFTTNCT